MVVLVRRGPCDHGAVALHLHDGVAERLGAGADRLRAGRRRDLGELLVVDDPPLPVRRVAATEPEAAPGDEGLVVPEPREVQELLEVLLQAGHGSGEAASERDQRALAAVPADQLDADGQPGVRLTGTASAGRPSTFA